MKKLLIIAIALTSVNAFASRARMLSLGSSVHLLDTQTVYDRPTDLMKMSSDYVALETGATGGVAASAQYSNAEGVIVRTMGDAKMALTLGRQSTNASSWGLRAYATAFSLNVNQQNPISFMYGKKVGDITWTGTLGYSNYNNKNAGTGTTLEKENSSGFNIGATSGAWDAALSSGFGNSAQVGNGNKLTGTGALTLSGGYKLDTMYFFGKYSTAAIKVENNLSVEQLKAETTIMNVGVANSHKKDGSELFYSIAYNQTDAKVTTTSEKKDSSTTLPITIGFEADAASWLTLRGSVTQSTLINKSKTEISTTTEVDPGANSTTVAAGAGLKFNKVNVDGTILNTTASTQGKKLDSSELLAQVGLTYNF